MIHYATFQTTSELIEYLGENFPTWELDKNFNVHNGGITHMTCNNVKITAYDGRVLAIDLTEAE